MNCRGCRQTFLPVPDLSTKIEGDSVRRVATGGIIIISPHANRRIRPPRCLTNTFCLVQ